MRPVLGCEVLLRDKPRWLFSSRLGLLCHYASVTSNLKPLPEELVKIGANLKCLFSPQHGFFPEKQANMIESDHQLHPRLQIPIYSLYGPMKSPPPEVLEGLDFVLVDLQDVGARVYTYTSTMGLTLEACARSGISVVILDRPNPLGCSQVEGNVVEDRFRSFVGRYRIPMRHGLTMGEYARWIVKEKELDIDLRIITVERWRASQIFPETRLPWVLPSPNMPSFETAIVYPGMVCLEGTNLSEGRGTTLPFQIFGAPFIDPYRLEKVMKKMEQYGVVIRPIFFEPVADKWKGQRCGGFQIHVIDPQKIKPYTLGLMVLQAIIQEYPHQFEWLPPPYEYEYEKLPIDIILGSQRIRNLVEKLAPLEEIEQSWQKDLAQYMELREDCRLYR
ncbi:MAG: DUF1343 domain-containing protein [Deltaproteobacteria bacterium]|nr:DUF1343 domain-containing protein [Deltaproteobacteria bacterium]MBW2069035.1 DUF1343 domain-containing protein [Deltaproteobacteria bacterium]